MSKRTKIMALAAACGLGGLLAGTAAGRAGAATLYDTTNVSSTAWDYNGFGPAFVLDDAAVTGGATGAVATAVKFGYANHDTAAAHNVDAVVTFYGTVNTNAGDNDVVNSNGLGSARFSIGTVPAAPNASNPSMGVTGSLSLPSSITLPANAFAVEIDFYDAGTNNRSTAVDGLLVNALPTVGTTVDGYYSDDSDSFGANDHVFHGGNNGYVAPPGGSHDNLYLQVTGTVPEPTSLALLGGGVGLLLARRRRRAAGR